MSGFKGMIMDEEQRAVMLPKALIKRIEEKIKSCHYASVDDYVEDVLNEVLKAEDMEIHLKEKEKMEEIRERLKQLGYMD
jgi:Arc/MetJ-type ribon-helix-helix transcriptional regulator